MLRKPRSKEGEQRRLAGIKAYYATKPHFSEERRKQMSEITKRQWVGKTRTLADRLWCKINIGADRECWNWKKPFRGWYPQLYNRDTKMPENAHRIAFLVHYGSIPKGAHICHKCDNRACCNPHHLYAGDPLTNVRDCIERKRFKFLQRKQGSQVHNAKLTDESVRLIRKEFNSVPRTAKGEYARRFGCRLSVIRRIANGTGWEHVK